MGFLAVEGCEGGFFGGEQQVGMYIWNEFEQGNCPILLELTIVCLALGLKVLGYN
jgi:hypothetical protein